MENILNNYSISDILIAGFVFGTIFCMIQDLIISLIDYLNYKAWLVRDYEELIYNNLKVEDVLLLEEKDIVIEAVNNYSKRKAKEYKLNKFLDKFRRRKNG